MLSPEENALLTEVGPGKPAGDYLRRFWHPVAISDQWDGIKTLWNCDRPVDFRGERMSAADWGARLGTFDGGPTPIRILGEDLVLYRDKSGTPGLIQECCPHRGTSFEHGRIQENGIACCYHGWAFDRDGRCRAMPAEPADTAFPEKVTATAYPVREMGGLLWAYMGPDPAPVLPRYDVVARQDGVRAVENFALWPCNWFQICENSVDQSHTGILHGGAGGERADIWGGEIPQNSWDEMPMGIRATSRRVRQDYTRVSYYLMPTINRLPQPFPGGDFRWPRFSAIWRTPVDDGNTMIFSVCFTPEVEGVLPELPAGVTFDVTGQLHVHRDQDFVAIASQGRVLDRSGERLATSDAGVILLRKMVMDGIADVQAGREPRGLIREDDGREFIDLENIVSDPLNSTAAAE